MRVCVFVGGWMWMHERGRVLAYLSRMPRAGAVLSASSLTPACLSTLSHERHDFGKKVTVRKMCVLSFCITLI
jgi:hypothetical protein